MKEYEERLFIEKVGLSFEQLGLPRMAGRIFGWLLIAETLPVSMNDLMTALQASKSSISSISRLLINANLIEVVRIPGVRRDYFQIRKDAWKNALKVSLAKTIALRQIAEEGLDLLQDSPLEKLQRLQEMYLFSIFFEEETPLLLDRWEKKRQSQIAK
jgi:DNA-binding transcriptional regulator GbsR (MarR family)